MSSSVFLYPILTEGMIHLSGYSFVEPVYSYQNEGETVSLEVRESIKSERSGRGVLHDPNLLWTPENYNLNVSHVVTIPDASSWFGEHGICPTSAVLGLAKKWISTGSDVQGMKPFAEFDRYGHISDVEVITEFEKDKIRKSLIMQTVVYLKRSGHPANNEIHLCNVPGTILGVLDEYEIYVDGNGSMFPISTISEPGAPLWTVYFDVDDVTTDLFESENLEILLNQAHRDYPMLDPESDSYNRSFLTEVLASALTLLFDICRHTAENAGVWDDILSGDNYEPGSVADAIHYFIDKLHWDIATPIGLSDSIHRYLDENMKGAVR